MRIIGALLTIGLGAWSLNSKPDENRPTGGDSRIYELRTYYALPGKMPQLHARFRNHTCKLFQKHGMTIVGFWSPTDEKAAAQKLVYVLSFPSKEAAVASWKAFRDDPEWKAARAESEKDGKLVEKAESIYMQSTDYAPTAATGTPR